MAANVAVTIAYVLLQGCLAQEAKVPLLSTTLSSITSSVTVDTSLISAAVGKRPTLPLETTTITPTLSSTTLVSASAIPNFSTVSSEIFRPVTPPSSSQIITGSPFTVDTHTTSTLFSEPSPLPSVAAPFESTTASRTLPKLSPLDILPLAPVLITRSSASSAAPKPVRQQSLMPSGSRVPQVSPVPPKVVKATFQISSTSSEPPTANTGTVSVPSMAPSTTVPASIVLSSGLSPSVRTELASTIPSSSLLAASPSSSQLLKLVTTTSLPTKFVLSSTATTESTPAPLSLSETTKKLPRFAGLDLSPSFSDCSTTKPVEILSTTTFSSSTKSTGILTSLPSIVSTIGVAVSPLEVNSANQPLPSAANTSAENGLITSSATSSTLISLPTVITTLAALPRETSVTVTFSTTPPTPASLTGIISDTSTLPLAITTGTVLLPSTNRPELTKQPENLSSSSLPSIITTLLMPRRVDNLSVTTTNKPRKLRKYPKFRFKVYRFRTITNKLLNDMLKRSAKATITPSDSNTTSVLTTPAASPSTSAFLPTATGLPPNDKVAVISSNGFIEPRPGMPLDGGNFFNILLNH